MPFDVSREISTQMIISSWQMFPNFQNEEQFEIACPDGESCLKTVTRDADNSDQIPPAYNTTES